MKPIEAIIKPFNNDSGGAEIFGENTTETPESLEVVIELTSEELLELISQEPFEGNENNDSIQIDGHWLVFFQGRNTSTVATGATREDAIKNARSKGVAGGDKPVVSARQATSDEEAAIRDGKWLRVRANGNTNSSSGSFTYRKHLKAKSKGNNVGV